MASVGKFSAWVGKLIMAVKNVVAKVWSSSKNFDNTLDSRYPSGNKPPAAPVISAAQTGTSGINIGLVTPSPGAAFYVIERSPDGSTAWTVITSGWNGAAPFSDTPLADNTRFYYRAFAVANAVYSAASTVVSAKTDALLVPVAPAIVFNGVRTSSTVSVNISGGSNIAVLTPRRSLPGLNSWTYYPAIPVNSTSYTFASLAASTVYDFQLVANNVGGDDFSVIVTESTAAAAGGNVLPFPMPPGRAMSAVNMPMQIINPRPSSDGGIGSYEAYRLHPTGEPVFLPIFVQGGRAPLHYSLSSNMPGAAIGEDCPADWFDNGIDKHGILFAPAQIAGLYTHTVTVTDQDMNTASVTWDQLVAERNTTSLFGWFDQVNGNDSNSGSWDSPWKDTMSRALGTTSTSTTFQGQIWLKSAGVYVGTGHTDLGAGNIRLDCTRRPVCINRHRAADYTPVDAVWSFAQARFNSVLGGNASGFYMDCPWRDYVASHANFQNFLIADGQNRLVFFNAWNSNIGNGTAGNDNATGVFFSNGASASESTYNKYVCFRNCKETGRPSASNSYGLVCAFGIKGAVFEDCHFVNSSSVEDIYLKDSCQEITVRYSKTDNTFSIGGQNQNGGVTRKIEYVHCVSNASLSSLALNVAHEGTNSTIGEVYVSRCTLVGKIGHGGATTKPTNGPFTISDTIVQTTLTPPVGISGGATVNNTGTELQGSGTYVDSNMKITAPYAAYRGTRGAEMFA
jgi:hypothetical protein